LAETSLSFAGAVSVFSPSSFLGLRNNPIVGKFSPLFLLFK
jgi:hypothetical protein